MNGEKKKRKRGRNGRENQNVEKVASDFSLDVLECSCRCLAGCLAVVLPSRANYWQDYSDRP